MRYQISLFNDEVVFAGNSTVGTMVFSNTVSTPPPELLKRTHAPQFLLQPILEIPSIFVAKTDMIWLNYMGVILQTYCQIHMLICQSGHPSGTTKIGKFVIANEQDVFLGRFLFQHDPLLW